MQAAKNQFFRKLHGLLTFVIAIYIFLFSVGYFAQNQFIYIGTTFRQSASYDESQFKIWQNNWAQFIGFKSTSKDSREAWLFFHGNGERAEVVLNYASKIRSLVPDAKIDIYVMEYPGYGRRPGKLTEKSLVDAAKEAIDLLSHEPKKLYVVGQSLGTGVSCRAVAQKSKKVSGYVMLTPFTSMQAAARQWTFQRINIFSYLFPVETLVSDPYRSIDCIEAISSPMAILACTEDSITPAWMAQKLREKKRDAFLVLIPGNHYVPLEPLPEVQAAFDFVRGREKLLSQQGTSTFNQ